MVYDFVVLLEVELNDNLLNVKEDYSVIDLNRYTVGTDFAVEILNSIA